MTAWSSSWGRLGGPGQETLKGKKQAQYKNAGFRVYVRFSIYVRVWGLSLGCRIWDSGCGVPAAGLTGAEDARSRAAGRDCVISTEIRYSPPSQ